MKLIKGYAVLSQVELDKALAAAEKRGAKASGKSDKARIEELTKSSERKEKTIDKLMAELADTKEVLETYKSERSEVRKVAQQQLANDDREALLDTRSESLDKKAASLADREQELSNEEAKFKKSSYADGLADGLRKAHEITQADRDNAMKIAMVSAASHTSTENLKELNSVHQITAGSSNSQG